MDGPTPRYAHWATGAFAVVVGLASLVVWFVVGLSMFDDTGLSGDLLGLAMFFAAVAGISAVAALISAALLLARTWSWVRLARHIGIAALAFVGVIVAFYLMLTIGMRDGCGGTDYEGANWRDPSLYPAVDAPITAPEGMPTGIPDVALDYIWAGEVSYANGTLYAGVPDTPFYEGAVRNDTRRFLEIATTLDDAAVEERITLLMENRTTYGNGRVDYAIEQAIDMDRFIMWLGAKEYPAQSVKREQIAAKFNAATKHTVLDNHTLVVDGWGNARMEYDWGWVPEADVKADVQDVLQRHGLPVPNFIQTRGGATISC